MITTWPPRDTQPAPSHRHTRPRPRPVSSSGQICQPGTAVCSANQLSEIINLIVKQITEEFIVKIVRHDRDPAYQLSVRDQARRNQPAVIVSSSTNIKFSTSLKFFSSFEVLVSNQVSSFPSLPSLFLLLLIFLMDL